MSKESEPAHSGSAGRGKIDPIAIADAALGELLGGVLPTFAISLSDNGLIIPSPDGVPVCEGRLVDIGSGMELCVPSEYQRIIDAWQSVCATGLGTAFIHLRADPSELIPLHFIDARHRFGTYLLVFRSRVTLIARDESVQAAFRPRLCVLERDRTGAVVAADNAATTILGWSRAELIGKNTLHLTHPDDRTRVVASWMECLSRPQCEQRGLVRYRHRDGHYLWFETAHDNLLANPAVGRIISQMIDVTDRMEAIEAQRAQAQLLRQITEALPVGILQMDAQRHVVHRNERLGAILGVANATAFDDQFALLRRADREALRAALDALGDDDFMPDIEVVVEHPNGERRCSIGLRKLTAHDGTATGAIACVADVTDSARLRDELKKRATRDKLTQCFNRAAILELLAGTLRAIPAVYHGLAVLFVDLDGFKQINDTYGHAAGDDVLRRAAQRISHGVRPHDVVGRLGGDEFLIVCPDTETPQSARAIALRLDAALSQPITIGGTTITQSSSIGVAWTAQAIDPDALVARADAAMYQAKRAKRGPVVTEASIP